MVRRSTRFSMLGILCFVSSFGCQGDDLGERSTESIEYDSGAPSIVAEAGPTVVNPNRPAKKILMIAANPTTSSVTGWPVGFWWAELSHPYWAFTQAGYEVEIRSPNGGDLQADGYSDPEDQSGYSASDILSLGFKKSSKYAALIQQTKSIDGVSPANYDAVFLAGGQSPMFTFRGNQKLETLVASFYEAGKVTALVCHATSLLLNTKLSDGRLLVDGKTWTGFANSEEQFVDTTVGQRVQPFWIEDEARKIPATSFVVDEAFHEFAVKDGLLVTGQQQHSSDAAARLVIEALTP